MSSANQEEIRCVRVWSGWLRLSHWAIAFGVLFQTASAWAIDQGAVDAAFWRDWHLMVGQVLLMALLLRFVLLFFPGSSHWRALLPDRSQSEAYIQMVKFYLTLARTPLPNWYAHNPFWKPLYAMVLLVLAASAATGVLLGAGPADPERLLHWHRRLSEVLIVFTLFHVVTVFLHDLKGRGAYLSAMISGYRYFHIGARTDVLGNRFEGPSTVAVSLETLKKRPDAAKRDWQAVAGRSSVLRLSEAMKAWGTPDFTDILKREIEQLDTRWLPLQQALSRGSHVGTGDREAMILGITEEAGSIRVKAGVFYTGVIAGCNCADDPTPVAEEPEYCELRFDIDTATALATVTLLDDGSV